MERPVSRVGDLVVWELDREEAAAFDHEVVRVVGHPSWTLFEDLVSRADLDAKARLHADRSLRARAKSSAWLTHGFVHEILELAPRPLVPIGTDVGDVVRDVFDALGLRLKTG